jgi:16S rRNA (guanine527-N7)-methyltransferase
MRTARSREDQTYDGTEPHDDSMTREPLALPEIAPLVVPERFVEDAAALGASIDAQTATTLATYLSMLLAMNERMNLTAITDVSQVWTRHALDALSLLPELAALPPGSRVIDVGSGGGVPAIPLAIARRDLSFVLVEATKKKAAFLEAITRELNLPHVSVRAERAEVLARSPSFAHRFEAVTARAVARILELLPWTVPFAARGAKLLFIKGARAEEELREAATSLARWQLSHTRTTLTPTGRVVVLTVER